MDSNGNHVIQRCLQCLSNEDNKVKEFMLPEFPDIIILNLYLDMALLVNLVPLSVWFELSSVNL